MSSEVTILGRFSMGEDANRLRLHTSRVGTGVASVKGMDNKRAWGKQAGEAAAAERLCACGLPATVGQYVKACASCAALRVLSAAKAIGIR